MMQKKIESCRDVVLKKIEATKVLDTNDKLQYTELITSAAEHTNGETLEQKVQGISECNFWINALLISHIIESTKPQKQKEQKLPLGKLEFIAKVQWAIVALGAIISLALILRPELAQLIMHLAGK